MIKGSFKSGWLKVPNAIFKDKRCEKRNCADECKHKPYTNDDFWMSLTILGIALLLIVITLDLTMNRPCLVKTSQEI